MRVNEMLINEMCGELPYGYEMPGAEVDWVRKMLEYNVCGGKMNRGLMVVECGREVFKAQGKELNNDMLTKFAILGWVVEWLQAWLLVADDFMDDSQTRRGQKCWYLQPHVKKIAINDAFMIEMLIFKVRRPHRPAGARRPAPRPPAHDCRVARPLPRAPLRASRSSSATSATSRTTSSCSTCCSRPRSRPSAASSSTRSA
jgi:hypothetical protein